MHRRVTGFAEQRADAIGCSPRAIPIGMLSGVGGPASHLFLLQRWENRREILVGWQGCVTPGKGPLVFVCGHVPK